MQAHIDSPRGTPLRRRLGRSLANLALRGAPQSPPVEREEVAGLIVKDPSGFYDDRFGAGYQRDFESGYDACALAAVEWALRRAPLRAPRPAALDYGCGQGRWLPELARILPGARLTGTDISRVGLALAAQRFPLAELVRIADGVVPAPDGSFDVVVMLDVIEHVTDATVTCADIARVLRPGGVAVLTTPCASTLSIPWLVNWLLDGFETTPDGFGRFATDEPAHLRRLSRKVACDLLESAGLRVRAVRFWGHGFTQLARFLPLVPDAVRSHVALLDWRVLRLVPEAGAMVIVATRESLPA